MSSQTQKHSENQLDEYPKVQEICFKVKTEDNSSFLKQGYDINKLSITKA